MSLASVTALAADLSNGRADPASLVLHYRDILKELLLGEAPQLPTRITSVPVEADTAIYELPPDAVKPLMFFFDGEKLDWTTSRLIESVYGEGWRSIQGDPVAVVTEVEDDRTFRVFPTPTQDSVPVMFPPDPFGVPAAVREIAVLHTVYDENLRSHLDLPLALLLLEREFLREGEVRDPLFAKACGELGRQVLRMVV